MLDWGQLHSAELGLAGLRYNCLDQASIGWNGLESDGFCWAPLYGKELCSSEIDSAGLNNIGLAKAGVGWILLCRPLLGSAGMG